MRRLLVAAIAACQATAPPRSVARAPAGGAEGLDSVARQCARIASCAHSHDAPRFRDPSRCVDYWLEHLNDGAEPIPACLLVADSCTAVEACLHPPASAAAAAFCIAHPGLPTACDGDSLVTCSKDDPAESTATPCASLGASCGETRGAGGLVSRACINGALCPADVSRATCDGEHAIVSCHDLAIERASCRPGTRCRAHQDGDGEELASCESDVDVPCDKVGSRVCHGARLGVCEVHGHHADERSIDCASLGLSCIEHDGRAMCAPGPGDCGSGAPRCEGPSLVFCAAGRTERVPCDELGLGACEAEGRGPVALCGVGAPKRKR